MDNNYLLKRNTAIDILRALTMATMLMVNDFWSVSGIAHWLGHADTFEDFLGFSDLVFPTFLFCVGLSIPYAISNMRAKGKSDGDVIRHILTRSFALIVMGAFIYNNEYGIDPSVGYTSVGYSAMMATSFFLIYNNYKHQSKYTTLLKAIGWAVLIFLLVSSRNDKGEAFNPHWWGILGLIGWAYLFCALVYALSTRLRTSIIAWAFLVAVCFFNTPTAPWFAHDGGRVIAMPDGNIWDLVCSILRVGNGASHLLVMSGMLFAMLFIKKSVSLSSRAKAIGAIGLAAAFAILGILSHEIFIISKNLSTLTWVFYMLAIDVLLYALLDYLVEKRKDGWAKWIRPAGTATLTCYFMPHFLYALTSATIGWQWSQSIPAPFGFFKCVLFSALCILITYALGKASIKLKV